MDGFVGIIKDFCHVIQNENEKRIITTALDILELQPIITDDEINVLNHIFVELKKDNTISIDKDRKTLEFIVLIRKQKNPVVDYKNNIKNLCKYLESLNLNLNSLEQTVLTYFNACQHIEENEIIIIKRLVDSIAENWTLKPIEHCNLNGESVSFSRFVPNYSKRLIRN